MKQAVSKHLNVKDQDLPNVAMDMAANYQQDFAAQHLELENKIQQSRQQEAEQLARIRLEEDNSKSRLASERRMHEEELIREASILKAHRAKVEEDADALERAKNQALHEYETAKANAEREYIDIREAKFRDIEVLKQHARELKEQKETMDRQEKKNSRDDFEPSKKARKAKSSSPGMAVEDTHETKGQRGRPRNTQTAIRNATPERKKSPEKEIPKPEPKKSPKKPAPVPEPKDAPMTEPKKPEPKKAPQSAASSSKPEPKKASKKQEPAAAAAKPETNKPKPTITKEKKSSQPSEKVTPIKQVGVKLEYHTKAEWDQKGRAYIVEQFQLRKYQFPDCSFQPKSMFFLKVPELKKIIKARSDSAAPNKS